MPPNGLYPIPRHHTYGSRRTRPKYNSKDFESLQVDSAANQHHLEDEVSHGSASAKTKTKDDGGHASHSQKRKRDVSDGGPKSPHCEPQEALDHFERLLKIKNKEAKSLRHKSTEEDKRTTNNANESSERKARKSKSKVASLGTNAGPDLDDHNNPPEASDRSVYGAQHKRNKMSVGGVLLKCSPIRQTPIQLPGTSQESRHQHASSLQHQSSGISSRSSKAPSIRQRKTSQHDSRNRPLEAQVMVPETPPSVPTSASRAQVKTPIPFPPVQQNTPSTNTIPKEANARQPRGMTANHSSFKANPVTGVMPPQPPKVTQRLNDEPKPRPRLNAGSRASSTDPSSRASSASIPEMFSRMAKSQTPINLQSIKAVPKHKDKKTDLTDSKEVSLCQFNGKSNQLQRMINFAKEKEFLELYINWYADNDNHKFPLPCLGSASGCSARKEEILRLSKEEHLNLAKLLDTTVDNTDSLHEADRRFQEAEGFFIQAIRARIPVPLGRLEGVWTLYCPKYSETHVDRYGYGMRTLEICPISGSKNLNIFTARLHIPPRSMAYLTHTFAAPPHASFRITTVVTTAESYKMDIIFLGNGYLRMRIDLNQLLRGKPTEIVDGKQAMMELIGIHEQAMW